MTNSPPVQCVADAYHSLPIEGYRVSADLILRVRSGAWNPETNQRDREQHNAMAARGYWQPHQGVQTCIGRVLKGENLVPGDDCTQRRGGPAQADRSCRLPDSIRSGATTVRDSRSCGWCWGGAPVGTRALSASAWARLVVSPWAASR